MLHGEGDGEGGIHRCAGVRLFFVSSLRLARGAPILFGPEHAMAKTGLQGTAGRRTTEASQGYGSGAATRSRPAAATISQIAATDWSCITQCLSSETSKAQA